MSTAIRVLMYGWEFPPYISGGLGIACYGITTGLSKHNVAIDLILPQQVYSKETAAWSHITTHFIKAHAIDPYATSTIHKKHLYGKNLIEQVQQYAKRAGQLAKFIDHDIIHAHDWLTILAGINAKKISGKPLIFHTHALEPDRSGEHINQAVFAIEQYGMREADRIIAVSHYTKRLIIQQYGISEHKISVAHNGIFPSQLNPTHQTTHRNKNIILFVGRLTFQKGPAYFIEAAYKLLQQRQDVLFVIVGKGDLWRSCIEQVAKLGIGLYVHFTGFLNREQVIQAYQMSKVYVMPSVSEPFGLTCLEAMSYGVPVVISKNTGAAEVVPQVAQTDYWDTDAIAKQINQLLNQPELVDAQLQPIKAIMHRLLWSEVGKTIRSIYKISIGK